MEILSDATFKGNVSISGGDFSVTRKGESTPLLTSGIGDKLLINDNICVYGDVYINGTLEANCLCGIRSISLNDALPISNWSDLNNILNFAPKSLSTTVNSNTTKINSLCTTVAGIQPYTKHRFTNPTIPEGCTRFYFVDDVYAENQLYKFIRHSQNCFHKPSSFQVFKTGYCEESGLTIHEEIQMDIKQYFCNDSNTTWFEGILTSNSGRINNTEIIIIFDDFKEMCTTSIVPQ